MTGRLAGKVALISGAARGQGAAEAELFAHEGANVVIADVLVEQAEELAANLGRKGLDVVVVECDVTSRAAWEAAVAAARSHYGKLDILINNAGISTIAGVADVTATEWERVISINQTGPLLGMQAALPALRLAGGGSIVNVSSIYGLAGVPGYMAYQASKGALIQMSRAAAIDLASENVRVNTIAPGLVMTDMVQGEPAEAVADNLRRTPLGRPGTVQDIAYAALFLASDESSFITGIDLVVDGGYLAQ